MAGSYRPSRLRAEYTHRVLRHFAGSTRGGVVLVVIALILFSGVSSNAFWTLIQHVFGTTRGDDFPWATTLVSISAFPLLLVALRFVARTTGDSTCATVIEEPLPPKRRALILFLSPLGTDSTLVEDLVQQNSSGDIRDPSFRKLFRDSWRMPLEAIAYHLDRLEEVIAVPSSDVTGIDGTSQAGTWRELTAFTQLVRILVAKARPGRPPRIQGLDAYLLQHHAQLFADERRIVHARQDYSQGVNFEDAGALVQAVESAYEILRYLRIPGHDVLVDITSGKKVPTVAGAAAALAEGRRFQYVSNFDFTLKVYDVTYLP